MTEKSQGELLLKSVCVCVCVCFASSFVAYLELRVSFLQGAKKVIFTACHSGKLKKALLAQMSFQLAPKAFWRAELISQLFFSLNSSKNITCPLGKLRTEFTSPIAKSTSPGQSDTNFLWKRFETKKSRTTYYIVRPPPSFQMNHKLNRNIPN